MGSLYSFLVNVPNNNILNSIDFMKSRLMSLAGVGSTVIGDSLYFADICFVMIRTVYNQL